MLGSLFTDLLELNTKKLPKYVINFLKDRLESSGTIRDLKNYYEEIIKIQKRLNEEKEFSLLTYLT